MKLEQVTKNIILIKCEKTQELAETVMRFQEYYESGFPEIRGKIFTLGYLKKLYSEKNGASTYAGNSLVDADYGGFNFPGHVLNPFIKGLFDPLTEGERAVVDLFRYREDDFYIIAVADDNASSMQHEINHGLFYTNKEFRDETTALIRGWDQFENFKNMMRDWGYCDEVMVDEAQAYICCDYDWLLIDCAEDVKKFNLTIDEKLSKSLQDIKKKYYKPLDKKFEVE